MISPTSTNFLRASKDSGSSQGFCFLQKTTEPKRCFTSNINRFSTMHAHVAYSTVHATSGVPFVEDGSRCHVRYYYDIAPRKQTMNDPNGQMGQVCVEGPPAFAGHRKQRSLAMRAFSMYNCTSPAASRSVKNASLPNTRRAITRPATSTVASGSSCPAGGGSR